MRLLILSLNFIFLWLNSTNAIWSCTNSSSTKSANSTETKSQMKIPSSAVSSDRETVYWCSPETSEKYIATILNPSSTPKSVSLSSIPYGILDIIHTNNLQADESDLRRELKHQFGWTNEQLSYLGEVKSGSRQETLKALSGSIYFQSSVKCFNELHSEFSKTLPPSFTVLSEPFEFNLPFVGNCIPTDQYLPIRQNNDELDEDDLFWFENTSENPKTQELHLLNYGFIWKLQEFHHLKTRAIQHLFSGPNAIIPVNDSLITTIREELIKIFSSLKTSPTTNLSWKQEYFHENFSSNNKLFPIVAWNSTRIIIKDLQPKSNTRFFQLVGKCGNYTIYTAQIFSRVYDLSKKNCMDAVNGSGGEKREGIEKCEFCKNLECSDETKFLENNIEYVI